jgi:hypothetical protein
MLSPSQRALRVHRDVVLPELIVERDPLAEQRHGVVQPALVDRALAIGIQRGQAVEQSGHGVHRAVSHRGVTIANSDQE